MSKRPTYDSTRKPTWRHLRGLKPGTAVVFVSSPDRFKRARVVSVFWDGTHPLPHTVRCRDSGGRLFDVDATLIRLERATP